MSMRCCNTYYHEFVYIHTAEGYQSLSGENESDGHNQQAKVSKEAEGKLLMETSLSVETVHDGNH